ncbi:MAG: polysaccharide biosynthesis/export family protein [Myxococcota bacterium]|nr:polysaccharide biosynthesis/export family protein [Myxococcota bacterium]
MVLAACSAAPTEQELLPLLRAPSAEASLASATLGPGDVFEVRIYQEPTLSGLYRVDATGDFEFPLLGPVRAEGQSASSLAQHLNERLAQRHLRNPQASVFVKEFNSKKVFVLGQVNKPGEFRFVEQMSIVQAIALAGGLKTLAAKELILTRVLEGREKKFRVPFHEISLGRAQNISLQPGDIIFVPESWL